MGNVLSIVEDAFKRHLRQLTRIRKLKFILSYEC